jgi:HAMP domain-containing protein
VSDPTENRVQSLPDRYGTARPRRGPLVIVLAVLVVGGLTAWAVWATITSRPAIEATLTSYHVVSTHEIRVKVVAQFRPADVDGTCLVRASAQDHTVVGELNLTADELRAARGAWIPMRTERRATTAELVRCSD